jgi:hypothetical protein
MATEVLLSETFATWPGLTLGQFLTISEGNDSYTVLSFGLPSTTWQVSHARHRESVAAWV